MVETIFRKSHQRFITEMPIQKLESDLDLWRIARNGLIFTGTLWELGPLKHTKIFTC